MILFSAPDEYSREWFEGVLDELRRADLENVKKGEDIELPEGVRVILLSPDGSRWALSADNSGALTLVAA